MIEDGVAVLLLFRVAGGGGDRGGRGGTAAVVE